MCLARSLCNSRATCLTHMLKSKLHNMSLLYDCTIILCVAHRISDHIRHEWSHRSLERNKLFSNKKLPLLVTLDKSYSIVQLPA